MPLFGKKDVSKKTKKDAEKSQSIEDKYDVKDLLGTWVQTVHILFNKKCIKNTHVPCIKRS